MFFGKLNHQYNKDLYKVLRTQGLWESAGEGIMEKLILKRGLEGYGGISPNGGGNGIDFRLKWMNQTF